MDMRKIFLFFVGFMIGSVISNLLLHYFGGIAVLIFLGFQIMALGFILYKVQ